MFTRSGLTRLLLTTGFLAAVAFASLASRPAVADQKWCQESGDDERGVFMFDLYSNYPSGNTSTTAGTNVTVCTYHSVNVTMYTGTPDFSGNFYLFYGSGLNAMQSFELNSEAFTASAMLTTLEEVALGDTTVRANTHVTSPFLACNDTHTLTGTP